MCVVVVIVVVCCCFNYRLIAFLLGLVDKRNTPRSSTKWIGITLRSQNRISVPHQHNGTVLVKDIRGQQTRLDFERSLAQVVEKWVEKRASQVPEPISNDQAVILFFWQGVGGRATDNSI